LLSAYPRIRLLRLRLRAQFLNDDSPRRVKYFRLIDCRIRNPTHDGHDFGPNASLSGVLEPPRRALSIGNLRFRADATPSGVNSRRTSHSLRCRPATRSWRAISFLLPSRFSRRSGAGRKAHRAAPISPPSSRSPLGRHSLFQRDGDVNARAGSTPATGRGVPRRTRCGVQ